MKLPRFLLLVLAALTLHAADSTDEEMIDLSPFEISPSDVAYETLKSVPMPESLNGAPPVAITLKRRADSVYMQLALTNSDDKQDLRNADLQKSIATLTAEIQKLGGYRVEQREIKLSTENKKLLSMYRGSTVSSSQVVVFADLGPDTSVGAAIQKLREALLKTKLAGTTKLRGGVIGLYVKDPNQYRRELITKIFEDLEFLKAKIGPDFEVQPSGFARQVSVKACSENDVELWLDYSFTIRSIREINAKP